MMSSSIETASGLRLLCAEWVLPITAPPIRHGYVLIRDERLLEVAPLAQLGDSCQAREALAALPESALFPAPGSLISPGLINAHTHLEQSFPAPIPKAADEPFTDWLLAVVRRNMAENSPAQIRQRCEQGALELLRTGTTCVNDIASSRTSLEVLDQLGLRGAVSLEFFHPGFETLHIQPIIEAYARFRAGYEAHARLKAGLSPHSPYNVSPAAWKAVLEACNPPLVHTHAAEFADEVAYLRGECMGLQMLHERILGRSFEPQVPADSPVAYLHAHGLLDHRTVLAHAVHTSPTDRQFIAAHAAGIAHCPRSNRTLHQQTLSAADWADSGVCFSLGTDGRLSTENLDLRAEARCARELHGLEADTLLDWMTLSGARLMGLGEETGSLTPGKWADVVLWQTAPDGIGSPAERLLDARTVAREVLVGGQVRWSAEGQAHAD